MANNFALYTRDMALHQRALRHAKDIGDNLRRTAFNVVGATHCNIKNQILGTHDSYEWIKSRHEQRKDARSNNKLGATRAKEQQRQQDEVTHAAWIENVKSCKYNGHYDEMISKLVADNLITSFDAKQVFGVILKDQDAPKTQKSTQKPIKDLTEDTSNKWALELIEERLPTGGELKSRLKSTITSGFPGLTNGDHEALELNATLHKQLLKVLEFCQNKTPEADMAFGELINGFDACQTVQQLTLQSICHKIDNNAYKGSFLTIGTLSYEDLKHKALEDVILAKFPGCKEASSYYPYEQFEHIKTGFLAYFGKELNLCDPDSLKIAKGDKDRYRFDVYFSPSERAELKGKFSEALREAQDDFLIAVANNLNDPGNGVMEPGSDYSNWASADGKRARKFNDCFYEEGKTYPKGLNPPLEQHKDDTHLYFHPDDVRDMLTEMKTASPTQTKSKVTSALAAFEAGKTYVEKEIEGNKFIVKVRKEGAGETEKTIITFDDNTGWKSYGVEGISCSLMLPDNSLRINGKELDEFDADDLKEKLDTILKSINRFNS